MKKKNNLDDIKKFINDTVNTFLISIGVNFSRIVINTGTGRATGISKKNNPETYILLDLWTNALRNIGWLLRHIRIWVKAGGLPASVSPISDVIDQHWEFIATFYNPKGNKRGQNKISEKWCQQGYWNNIKGEARMYGHIASYPVEIPLRNIKLYVLQNEIVYDPFLGSGTTLIAAEKTNRICYGMEIDPYYCDVIIERWEQFTGQKAELVK